MSLLEMNVRQISSYRSRVMVAADNMKRLGRGAQKYCSKDINQDLALISRVLAGKFIDDFVLSKIEGWLSQYIQAIKKAS